jgi:hypothetical protein
MKIETLNAMAYRHHPLQALIVTFAPGLDGLRMLSVLKNYADKGYVRFESEILVLAILHSRDWDRTGRKLTMHFVNGALWKEDGFLQLAENSIERIEIASSSPLNCLQSSRQKKREEAVTHIAAAVLTTEVRNEISEWGLKVSFHPLEVHGLHSMCITVDDDKTTVFSLFLEGWSGNLLTSHGEILCNCSSFETAQNELRKMLAKYLEEATA